MFFRRTKVANGLDGKSYYTYRLVENQREGTKTRQKTMLNLGANWDVPQSDWKAVAQRVEAIQQGQISCFDFPKHVESAAQSVVNRLRARDLNGDKPATGSVVTVDLDTMKHTDQRFPIKFKLSGPAANLGARHGPAGIVRFGGTAALFRRLPGR